MKSNPDRLITRRTNNIFNSQKRRAKQHHSALNYKIGDLHAIVRAQLGHACPYCCEGLTAKNFSADHRQPVSRSGRHKIDNLVICCERCNQTKGMMNDLEFIDLLNSLDHFPPNVRANTLSRLRAGGKMMRR
jgi:5-methylcytosine-specific restriction endonuclease McrA